MNDEKKTGRAIEPVEPAADRDSPEPGTRDERLQRHAESPRGEDALADAERPHGGSAGGSRGARAPFSSEVVQDGAQRPPRGVLQGEIQPPPRPDKEKPRGR